MILLLFIFLHNFNYYIFPSEYVPVIPDVQAKQLRVEPICILLNLRCLFSKNLNPQWRTAKVQCQKEQKIISYTCIIKTTMQCLIYIIYLPCISILIAQKTELSRWATHLVAGSDWDWNQRETPIQLHQLSHTKKFRHGAWICDPSFSNKFTAYDTMDAAIHWHICHDVK